MIPTKDGTITTSGNLEGKKVQMTFDPASVRHLMGVLTDLYSDKELAVIREYSTNAWDSHVEAGTTRPIEVSTPTVLDQNFRVKDYGVGMSADDIENIYSLFCASTKRETNTQVGMLGLGCKSALTFASQFYLIAVKSGVLTRVLVYRDETGVGVMEILGTSSTSAENGVEVVIPTPCSSQFETKVNEFFKYWPPDAVLINGKRPETLENAEHISENVMIVPHVATWNNQSSDRVVMGNVSYRLLPPNTIGTDGFAPGSSRGFNIVARLPIGAVDVVPSREDLHFTDKTLAAIEELRGTFIESMRKKIQDEVDLCQTTKDAMQVWNKWQYSVRKIKDLEITFRGTKIVDAWDKVKCVRVDLEGRDRQSETTGYITYGTLTSDTFINVVGYTGSRPSRAQKEKMRVWRAKHFGTTNPRANFHLFDALPGGELTKDIKTYQWKDITSIDAPVKPANEVLPDHVYLYQGSYYRRVKFEDLPADKKIVYFTPAELSKSQSERLAGALPSSEFSVIKIYAKYLKGFLKNRPGAVHYKVAVETRYTDLVAGLDDRQMKVNGILGATHRILTQLKRYADKIKDPEVADMAKLMDLEPTVNSLHNLAGFAASVPSMKLNIVPFSEATSFPTSRYPLLSSYTYEGLDMLLYINAKYDYLEESK